MTDDSAMFPLAVGCLSLGLLAAVVGGLAWIARRAMK